MNERIGIGRPDDAPLHDTVPVQLVYRKTIALLAGAYTWPGDRELITVQRPLIHNAVYILRNMSLTADVEETDYTAALTSVATEIPKFMLYLEGTGDSPEFREEVSMPTFLKNYWYHKLIVPHQTPVAIKGSWRGKLNQIPALIGKASITLTAVITLQEVIDDRFAEILLQRYPLHGDSQVYNGGR